MEGKFFSAVVLSLGTGLISCSGEVENKVVRPNIIYIMADDLGYGDLSCYGATKIQTPNIDNLAADGIRFTDAHSPASVSTPSRYGVLTGRYCWRGRLKKEVLWCGYVRSLIEPNRKTIGNMMKEQGYHTAQIGKWHLGWEDEEPIDYSKGFLGRGPKDLGFDYSFVTASAHNLFPITFVENHKILSKLKPVDYHIYQREKMQIPEFIQKWHDTHDLGPQMIAEDWQREQVDSIYAEKAIAFIKDHFKSQKKNTPFYLHLTPEAPHAPNNVPDFLKGSSKAGMRGDHVQMLDWVVGKLVDTVKELGIEKNTFIIFTSDNGAVRTGTDGCKGGIYGAGFETDFGHKSCGNLKGFKASLEEGGHRVPFIVSWPGTIEKGKVSDQLISSIDMMASLASLTDYKLSNDMGEDSYNVLPILLGKTQNEMHDILLMQHYNGKIGIRKGEWAYFKGSLYNVEKDPNETANLIDKYPDLASELDNLLQEQINKGRTVPMRN